MAAALLLGGASAVQLPLYPPYSIPQSPQVQIPAAEKHLVSSEALQEQIDPASLLRRAKTLYRIAEQGIDEFNHPTRVIGSRGMFWAIAPIPDPYPLRAGIKHPRPSRYLGLHLFDHRRAGRLL